MIDRASRRVTVWLTFAVICAGLLLSTAAGGLVWSGNDHLQVFTLAAAGSGGLAYLLWRTFVRRARVVRTPVDAFFWLAAGAVALSWLLSPEPRMGLSRAGVLLFYALLFYILLDAFEAGLDRGAVLNAALAVTGILLVLAGLEVYARYQQWWQEVGSRSISPPYPYRLTTLLGHANLFMGLVNPFAPLALVGFLAQGASRPGRVMRGLWLGFYLLAVPFCSSRGGWIGMGAWVFVLLVLWVMEDSRWRKFFAWLKPRWRWGLAAGMALAALAGAVLLRLWVYFSAHPSHGGGPFSGRSDIWANALETWQRSPWTGAGPGRFPFEYLVSEPGTVPAFWAMHAHSVPIQLLAEFGVIGCAAGLALAAAVGAWLVRRCRALPPADHMMGNAALAGLAAWAVQMLVDDHTPVPAVMVPLVLLAAWAVCGAGALARRRISLGVLLIPLALLIAAQAFGLWAYQPLAEALPLAGEGRWEEVAQAAGESALRDPHFSFYLTQSALAWSQAWSQSGQAEYLANARTGFKKAIQLEPHMAAWYANLAVLDGQAGETNLALEHIERAISLGPDEVSYRLNQGRLLEQAGQAQAAEEAYLKLLAVRPDVAGHPFWQESPLRQKALAGWRSGQATNAPATGAAYWQQASDDLHAGRLDEADQMLARAMWVGEPNEAIWTLQAAIYAARGDERGEQAALERLQAEMDRWNLRSYNLARVYAMGAFKRDGLSQDVVPGYLQLSPDVGQFAALERLRQMYARQGDCERAGRTWSVLQRAIQGGATPPVEPPPACP